MDFDRPSLSASLLTRAAAGDATAVDRLLRWCQPYLLAAANRGVDSDLRPKMGASDLVQETLIAAARDFPEFRGTSERELFAWLSRILENRLKMAVRQYKGTMQRDLHREQPLEGDGSVFGLFTLDQTPTAALIAEEEARRLDSALAQLDSLDRKLIFLRNWEEWTFDQIGAETEMTPSGARKAWVRAMQRLRRILKPDPPHTH